MPFPLNFGVALHWSLAFRFFALRSFPLVTSALVLVLRSCRLGSGVGLPPRLGSQTLGLYVSLMFCGEFGWAVEVFALCGLLLLLPVSAAVSPRLPRYGSPSVRLYVSPPSFSATRFGLATRDMCRSLLVRSLLLRWISAPLAASVLATISVFVLLPLVVVLLSRLLESGAGLPPRLGSPTLDLCISLLLRCGFGWASMSAEIFAFCGLLLLVLIAAAALPCPP